MTRFFPRALARLANPRRLPAFVAAGILASGLFAAAPAAAESATRVGDIALSHAWTRATPPNAKAGGGFVIIENTGGADDRLVAASAPVSARTELHEMAVVDGIMKMREMADGIPVPAGATVELKPGGLHVMFMGLAEPLKEGGRVPVTLTFEKAGTVTVDFTIEKMGAKAMDHGASGHGGHGGHGAKTN